MNTPIKHMLSPFYKYNHSGFAPDGIASCNELNIPRKTIYIWTSVDASSSHA